MTLNLLLGVLEDIFHGKRPTEEQLVQYALEHESFAVAWLIHALASDCSPRELATCLALCRFHQREEITELLALWPTEPCNEALLPQFMALLPSQFMDGFVPERPLLELWHSLLSGSTLTLEHGKEKFRLYRLSGLQAALQKAILSARSELTLANVYATEQLHQQMTSVRNNFQYISKLPSQQLIFALLQRAMVGSQFELLQYAEPLVVYQYLIGQQYKWHCDYILAANQEAREELVFFGQRRHTRILYLNSDFNGGDTCFKEWKIKVQAASGEMVAFDNLDADGNPDPSSVHCGTPVTSGEKWIATLWFRTKKNWLRQPLFAEIART